jgi:hypothetical protein
LQEDALAIMDTVTVLVASNRLSAAQEQALWQKGKRRPSHCLPFLECGRLPGQAVTPANFARAALLLLERPETQEVVTRALNVIGAFYRENNHAPTELRQLNEGLVTPIFARSTAIGSLMRKKIEPALGPVREALQTLAD